MKLRYMYPKLIPLNSKATQGEVVIEQCYNVGSAAGHDCVPGNIAVVSCQNNGTAVLSGVCMSNGNVGLPLT
jgi:hypothetical protein